MVINKYRIIKKTKKFKTLQSERQFCIEKLAIYRFFYWVKTHFTRQRFHWCDFIFPAVNICYWHSHWNSLLSYTNRWYVVEYLYLSCIASYKVWLASNYFTVNIVNCLNLYQDRRDLKVIVTFRWYPAYKIICWTKEKRS